MFSLAVGTPYVVNPYAMVDAMGHEVWAKWQAFNQVIPISHPAKMLGLIAQMIANYKTSDGQGVTMPWNKQDQPDTPEQRDRSTAAALASAPSALRDNVRTTTAGEFVL